MGIFIPPTGTSIDVRGPVGDWLTKAVQPPRTRNVHDLDATLGRFAVPATEGLAGDQQERW